MNESIEAFPLHWPLGYRRTDSHRRSRSLFKQGMETSQKFLRAEIDRLGAKGLIISTNIPVRKDGGLFTDWMSRKIDDPGVAIFFKLKAQGDAYISMCCDQYLTVWENIYALGKSIEAIRALERYGASEFMDRVFTGFKELPEQSSGKTWWEILEVKKDASPEMIRQAYLTKVKKAHPDAGGSETDFIQIQQAYVQASGK